MPSFDTHFAGHGQALRDTFAANRAAEMREHFATELHAALINCGVDVVSAIHAEAMMRMLERYDAGDAEGVMAAFAGAVRA